MGNRPPQRLAGDHRAPDPAPRRRQRQHGIITALGELYGALFWAMYVYTSGIDAEADR